MRIERAFIFAAGMGSRLRPYTDNIPKPMVEVWGKPIIDHIIDKLIKAGVKEIIVNTHYKADILITHLTKRHDVKIIISDEQDKLLDTGGGLKKAIAHFNSGPFYAINGDAFWIDSPEQDTLECLAMNWNGETSDILLLLQPIETMTLTKSSGDYDFREGQQIARNKNKKGTYAFTGIRILHPRIFDNVAEGVFSFLEQMDEAEKNNKLAGFVHQGIWHHISTPEDLENVNKEVEGNT